MALSEEDAPAGRNSSRRKKAFLALLTFQKKLQKNCGRFETASSWYDFVKTHLTPVLDDYADDLPKSVVSGVRQSVTLADTTTEGINKTCSYAQHDIARIVRAKMAHTSLGVMIAKATLVTAAVAAGGIIYLSKSAVSVTVRNQGCGTMPVTGSVPVTLPGLNVPNSIPDGGTGVFTLPPIAVTVDATRDTFIRVTVLGREMSFEIRNGLTVTVNGMDIIGNFTTIELSDRKTHDVVITCKE